jgi:cell division protein FtsL
MTRPCSPSCGAAGKEQKLKTLIQKRSKRSKRTRNSRGWKLLKHMGKKKKRKQRNPKVTVVFLCLMLVFIAELLFYTWCRVQSVRIKYEITAQTSRIRQLSAMQDNLKIEFARLKSPSRIAKIAKTQLGLITPTSKQTILIP